MSKIVRVIGPDGAGKRTFVGNLMYKCGGVDMLMLEKMQKDGVAAYDKVVEYFNESRVPLTFQSRKCTVKLNMSGDADYVIYIIDASIPLQALEEGGRNQDAAADKGALRRAKDLTVVVNKMDKLDWSEDSFHRIVGDTATMLRMRGVDSKHVRTIPISAMYGDNLIEPSPKSTWFSGYVREGSDERDGTFMEMLETVLSH